MSYNYLGLTNKVLRQLNEVELQSGNFNSAGGFHAATKDAVNYAIRDINVSEYQWPFNHVSTTQSLTTGVAKYALPADYKVIDWHTFYLEPDGVIRRTGTALRVEGYDYWHYNFRGMDADYKGQPSIIVPTQDDSFIVSPVPDKEYTLAYEYWGGDQELVDHGDTPRIPERFQNVIVTGALMWAYRFRDNYEQAQSMEKRFDTGIAEMRSLLINKYERAFVALPTARRSNRY